jgi:hypothetical protein
VSFSTEAFNNVRVYSDTLCTEPDTIDPRSILSQSFPGGQIEEDLLDVASRSR